MFESHDVKLYWDDDKTLALKIEITADNDAFRLMWNLNGEGKDITYLFGDNPDEYNNSTIIDNVTGIQYDLIFNQEETCYIPHYNEDGEIDDIITEYKGKCSVVGSDGSISHFPITVTTSIYESSNSNDGDTPLSK